MPYFLQPPAAVVGLYRRVTSSLWFTPGLYVLGGILLVSLVIGLGPHLPRSVLRLFPASDPVTVNGALQLLASSALTVATVTFSILMVVLIMAASSFSPRALAGFMRDRVDQNTLGMFLGAFAFGVGGIVLLQPGPASYDQRFLGLFLLLTVLLGCLVLGALVYFIHHTATALQIGNLVVRLHREADAALARFLQHAESELGQWKAPADLPSDPPGTVAAEAAGYIQVLDRDRVFRLAVTHDLVVVVRRHTGDFATRGIALCDVWPATSLTTDVADGLRAAYAVGAQRTAERDPLLGLELLAEIALRALSPGINDPATAVNCLDFIGDLLVRLAAHELPPQQLYDGEGRLRVVFVAPDFRDFLERSLLGIAGAGAGHARVVSTLLRVLHDVASVTQERERCSMIKKAASAIADLALQKLAFEREREQVEEALAKLDAVWAEPFG
jgi:uncharacterized membrane protein